MHSSFKDNLARISFSIACVVAGAATVGRGAEDPAARSVAFSKVANAPLYFEGNAGQFESDAAFIARGIECNVSLAPTEARILLGQSAGAGVSEPQAVRLQLLGANPAAKISGRDSLSARANYFIGSDASQWRAGVPLFSKVSVAEVYPGVQMIYYANQSAQLEYDFVLQPGAAAEQIHFRVTGADSVKVDAQGNLVLSLNNEEIQQHCPVAYQESHGVRTAVSASYRLDADGTIGFTLGQYNKALPLTIDPVLDFLTYLGGKKLEIGQAIALDGSGNIYVAGQTLSTGLKVLNPIQFGATNFSKFRGGNNAFGDAFVAKYDNSGVLQFLTYLGGKNDDAARGIVYDPVGAAVWVTGFTDSTNFPLVNPVRSKIGGEVKNAKRVPPVDAFICKLDPSGTSLLFSTYFGGDSIDEGLGIAQDENGGIYVTGITSSTNLIVIPPDAYQTNLSGLFDGFVTKLVGTGGNYTNAYTTYYGGTNDDYAVSVGIDSGMNAWLTGFTFSRDLRLVSPLSLPADVNPFFPDGYAFTNLNTEVKAKRRNVNNEKCDAFVAELNSTGTQLLLSSYVGGSNDDFGQQITVKSDNVYVTGYTLSDNFPTNQPTVITPTNFVPQVTNEVVFTSPGTHYISHVFVLKIAGGMLENSTAFGGSLADQGRAIAVDDNGLVYVTGSVSSTNFFQRPLLVTKSVTNKLGKIKYFGIATNSPAFTDLSNSNVTTRLKQNGNTNNVFVTVLSSDLTTYVQTMALGGARRDEANGIAVDSSGNTVYLVGTTTSFADFSTTNAAQSHFGGGGKNNNRLSDAFVSKITVVPGP
jgi:hypothetical protein